jgi:hypothetical protein
VTQLMSRALPDAASQCDSRARQRAHSLRGGSHACPHDAQRWNAR